jgi:hypothetical protein
MTAGRVLEVEIGQGDHPQDLVNSLLTNCATACCTFSVDLLGGGLLAQICGSLLVDPYWLLKYGPVNSRRFVSADGKNEAHRWSVSDYAAASWLLGAVS